MDAYLMSSADKLIDITENEKPKTQNQKQKRKNKDVLVIS